MGQDFRSCSVAEGYRNTYTRVKGIWYMEENSVDSEEGTNTPPHSLYPSLEDVKSRFSICSSIFST